MATYVSLVREKKIKGEGFPVNITIEAHHNWNRGGWVAKVVGSDPKYKFRRAFLDSVTPKEELSRAGNGYKDYKIEEPGVYECSSIWRSRQAFRVFLLVDSKGNVEFIDRKDVEEMFRTGRKLVAIEVDGPEPNADRFGDEYPEWTVSKIYEENGNEDFEVVYRARSFDDAIEFAGELAVEHGVELVNDAMEVA